MAQSDEVPKVDSFGSGYGIPIQQGGAGGGIVPFAVPKSVPGHLILPPQLRNIDQPDADKMWEQVIKDVNNFRASLPNDKHSLIIKLKALIQKRLDTWEIEPNVWDGDRWDEYCQAILRKLPNDKCEYAWNDVYNLAASECWGGYPDQKEKVLKAWALAEKICGDTSTSHNEPQTMPPLAPQRVIRAFKDQETMGVKITKKAAELGEKYPERWLNDEPRHIFKCNLFVDAVLRESGIRLPWKTGAIPLVKSMYLKLDLDSNHFVKVWPNGGSKFSEAFIRPGDIAFWDNGVDWQHSAILDGKGMMLYAGSLETHGFAISTLRDFIKTCYGFPKVIYRYKQP